MPRQGMGKSIDSTGKYWSGYGSHRSEIVDPYIDAMKAFLKGLEPKPTVVDLGYGDFSIGSSLRDYCGDYTACEIIKELIEYNKVDFSDLNVSFQHIDLTADALPQGDIAFVRLVLQHLSNDKILKATPKLLRYKYVLLTEHIPATNEFVHNLDKSAGSYIRLEWNSGVVLTGPSFDLKCKSESNVAQVEAGGGLIQTIIYEM